MNWKDRRIFSGQERGILSGMTPVEMTHGGMTPYPQEYQTGGMVGTELFEEGDEDINNALNDMATITNPEVPDMPDMPGMPVGPGPLTEVEEAVETGPIDEDYQSTVVELKQGFQNEIKEFVTTTQDAAEIDGFIKEINMVYSDQLTQLKKRFNIKIFSPEEDLLDPVFMQELEQLISMGSSMPINDSDEIPGYQPGGVVEPESGGMAEIIKRIQTQADLEQFGVALDIEIFKALKPKEKRVYLLDGLQKKQFEAGANSESAGSSNRALLERRINNAKKIGQAVRSNYASSGSRASHYRDASNAGKLAELKALDDIYKDATTASTRAGGRGQGYTTPADVKTVLSGAGAFEGEGLDPNDYEQEMLKLAMKESESPQINAVIATIRRGLTPSGYPEQLTRAGSGKPTLLSTWLRVKIDNLKNSEKYKTKSDDDIVDAQGFYVAEFAKEIDELLQGWKNRNPQW